MERCRHERPSLEEVEPGHRVACFKYHDVVAK
jgi:peptide/nickel transport system ATP-binding protein/oligopeptide transport system ATP-binding protein